MLEEIQVSYRLYLSAQRLLQGLVLLLPKLLQLQQPSDCGRTLRLVCELLLLSVIENFVDPALLLPLGVRDYVRNVQTVFYV